MPENTYDQTLANVMMLL